MAWLAPLLVLGLVILVHETGHFWAAKIFGVYAPRFAIGFGPALWRKRWGETEYVLGALPLGGYVRMATRDDEATVALEGQLDESKGGKKEPQDPNAMIPFGPKPVPENRWFESKPLWQRAIILLSGVTMNAILAIVVSSAVLAIYGQPTLRPPVRPVLASVSPGTPAAKAGLQAGDSIAAIDGTPTHTWSELVALVSAAPGHEIALSIVRGGQPREVKLTPMPAPDTNAATGAVRTVGRIGVAAEQVITNDPVTLGAAIAAGPSITWNLASRVVGVLKGLVTGKIGVSQLGGPIAIARTSVEAARTGFESVLELIAFLSINLAILNLVPIPLLDGGQLLLQTAETARGSAFSDQTREWIARIGLAAIATLFLVVTFNDLKSLVGSWMH